MPVTDYFAKQPVERQQILKDIHEIITTNDKTVMPVIEPMMGKEMIIYKAKGMMKYGLSSVKNYMSLHALPVYGDPSLHARYKKMLSKANFQKGCINFSSAEEMPLDIVQQLLIDCAAIDLLKIREEYLQSKKAAAKK